jgi:hypothetical protein
MMVSQPYCKERERYPRTGCAWTDYRMVEQKVCREYAKREPQPGDKDYDPSRRKN